MRRNRILPYILVAPTLVFVAAFTLLPLGEVLVGSLFKQRLNILKFRHPVFTGLGNFIGLFQDPEFIHVLVNTAVYLLVLIPLSLVASLALAFLL